MFTAIRSAPARRAGCLLAGLLLLALGRADAAEPRLFSFATSKGLPVKVLQDNDLPFIHAQLLVYLDSGTQSHSAQAILKLALLNLFERSLNSPPANLMDLLQRQGGDFLVEQTPEFVKISVNFLPDRLPAFSRLLKELFTYQSFHLGKFNASKERFWPLIMKGRDWKKEIAVALCYQQLVGNFYFSHRFLPREVINGINMAQVRSFMLRTFRPDNALLVLKGKVNPYFVLGMIEKDLPQPAPRAARPKAAAPPLNPARRIFILNVDQPEPPLVYWFDVSPAAADPDFLPFAVGNFSLFGFPGGRVYHSERNRFLMEGYKVETETIHLRDFTLFCNYLRLNYSDLENFLLLVEQERRRFAIRPIERKEYLDALNHLIGQAQVASSRFDHDLQAEIDRFHGRGDQKAIPRPGPEIFQEVSLNRVMQALDEQMGPRQKSGGREKGIVVLVGNADQILNSLKFLKTEAIELSIE